MKKNLIMTLLTCIYAATVFGESKLDTLYYDKDWKGVSSSAFAAFYRVLDANPDPNFGKKFRDYYITGELQAEGEYVSIDKYDDKNSVFTGPWINYYKSGKIEEKGTRVNSVDEGDYTCYYENGLVKVHGNFVHGKLSGVLTQFSEDGTMCRQDEYIDGNTRYDYYTLTNKDGFVSKYRISDNSPIWETPSTSERKITYKDGVSWPYYVKNGLVIGMSNTQVKDYGKYYQIRIVLTNHSMQPIEFDPDKTVAVLYDKENKEVPLEVLSCDEYMKKVRRAQNWSSALLGISQGLAAASAGYSTSTTNTNAYYNGYSNTYGTASAYGTGGYAYGNYSGHTNYSGSLNATSTTVTYDAAAAYQAQVIASERMAAYSNAQLDERNAKQQGYLKKTTVYPGETISGYINIKRKKGATMTVQLNINNIPYKFDWNNN